MRLMGRAAVAMALLAGTEACTWKSVVAAGAASPLANAPTSAALIELEDIDGRTAQIDPSTTLRFVRWDGATTQDVRAGSLCRNAVGLSDCETGALVTTWNDIANVEVEGFDAALTTFITSVVVVIVVAAIASKGGGGSGGNGGGGSARGSGGHGGGGYHGGGARVRGPDGGGSHIVIVPSVGGQVVVGSGTAPVIPPPGPPAPPFRPSPLFSDMARRRSVVAVTGSADGGTCLYGPENCSTGALRAGIRLANYVDLYGGVRTMWGWGLADGVGRFAPVGGIGLNGAFPRFKMLSYYFAVEAGGSDSLPFVFSIRAGLRVSPIPELAIGLFPFSPTYIDGASSRPHDWQFPTTLEVSTTF
jgi:hypothetical protein